MIGRHLLINIVISSSLRVREVETPMTASYLLRCRLIYFQSFQYYEHIEEMEWAIQVCKETNLPVAANMCIGPEGDLHGVSAADCAVRMAKAGADVGM